MRHLKMGLAAAALGLGFGLTGAEAAVNRPLPLPQAGDAAVVPVALCFRPGGPVFRIPGPPWECRRIGAFPARGGYGGGPYVGGGGYVGRPYVRPRPEYRGGYGGGYPQGGTYRSAPSAPSSAPDYRRPGY